MSPNAQCCTSNLTSGPTPRGCRAQSRHHRSASREPSRRLAWLLAPLALLLSGACGRGPTGPSAEGCGAGPFFTALPVALTDIDVISVVGGLGAPGHTLPTAQAGLILITEGATVYAPGEMQITELRRTTYITSPVRQGKTGFTADFQVCQQVSGWFGHLSTLSAAIPAPSGGWKDCQRYSTSTESVETCYGSLNDVTLAAGEPLGTSGLSLALGLMGLDFGLLDSRVTNAYLARWRFPTRLALNLPRQSIPRPSAQLIPSSATRAAETCHRGGSRVAGRWWWMSRALPKVSGPSSETQPVLATRPFYITLANYPTALKTNFCPFPRRRCPRLSDMKTRRAPARRGGAVRQGRQPRRPGTTGRGSAWQCLR